MPAVPKINPNHKRRVPKQRNRTRITPKVRKEVKRRSEGRCERCGCTNPYSFEFAHLEQASSLGPGDDPSNIAYLCGPSVNTGTCHNFADYTAKGREWRKQKKRELEGYYERQNH